MENYIFYNYMSNTWKITSSTEKKGFPMGER